MVRAAALSLALAGSAAGTGAAQTLTVDRAVELALVHSSQVTQAEASVLDARGSLYFSYSQILPRVSGSLSRGVVRVNERTGSDVVAGSVFLSDTRDFEQYDTTPTLSGSWSVLNLSSLSGWSAARSGLKAAQLARRSTHQDVVLATRRQFYEVVKAVQLSRVAGEALKLSRDNERRVHALFEVGSVSRSDVLKAQVQTAQSELDSIAKRHQISVQRIGLANVVGIDETQLSEVDTVLTPDPKEYDEAAVLAEAERARPDIQAAEAQLRAAQASLRSANFLRLPYLTVTGSTEYQPKSAFKTTTLDTIDASGKRNKLAPPFVATGNSKSDLQLSAQVGLTWNLFNGLANESQIASARARLLRARDSRDALRRNLAGEVRQTLLTYREVIESYKVAQRAIESATENLKLTQQKYNVGSAAILELIDAQVQLQTAQSTGVSALAAMRVAEAVIEKVRGHGD